jgi:hypothetical protein
MKKDEKLNRYVYSRQIRFIENSRFSVGFHAEPMFISYPYFMGGGGSRIYCPSEQIKENIIDSMELKELIVKYDNQIDLSWLLSSYNRKPKHSRTSPFSCSDFLPLHPELTRVGGNGEYAKASGVYKTDVVIDLQKLFRVDFDEIKKEDLLDDFKTDRWVEDGLGFKLQDKYILELVDYIVKGFIKFKFKSDQKVSMSGQYPLAIAIANEPSELGEMIGVSFDDLSILTRIDDDVNDGLFTHPSISTVLMLPSFDESKGILEAEKYLKTKILNYYGL